MHELVNGLAHLCSLRDRDALDNALVSLLVQAGQGRVDKVRLVRLLGDAGNLHCLTRAERLHGNPDCERRGGWVDWPDLPPLSQHQALAQAHTSGQVATKPGTPCLTVLPLGAAPPCMNLLEITSTKPLPEAVLGTLQGIARLYQNFEGLLDYGEKDALTELLNRKTFDGAFAKAAIQHAPPQADQPADRRSMHSEEGFWLAVLDIDFFKRVNDNYGHLIGDEVLLLMARLMRAHFRFQDQLYRFGGEEFVILMRCFNHNDAALALERFRMTVEAYEFPQVGKITVSIGFAALREDDTPGGGFDRADKAVYYAKGHGRNQVCSYQRLVDAGELSENDDDTNEIDFF
jgi:diguanylate cyclase (GGDEF)-like protein